MCGCAAGVAPPHPGNAAAMMEHAPFLYEGTDDDLPLVGSVSAVMPQFDWCVMD